MKEKRSLIEREQWMRIEMMNETRIDDKKGEYKRMVSVHLQVIHRYDSLTSTSAAVRILLALCGSGGDKGSNLPGS